MSEESPPAAKVVAEGNLTESDAAELARLRIEAAELSRTVKARETRLSELEDENRRLKAPPAAPEKKAWLDGWKPLLG